MHSAVQSIEKSLFCDSIRKEGYSVLVGKTLKVWMENSKI